MDKTVKELDDNLMSYSTITAANSQIRLNLVHKNNVKAFIQWTRDQYRLGLYPVLILSPVANVSEYIKRYKKHETYNKKSYTLTNTAKPEQTTDKIKWIDWYPTLINSLREIPVRNGVPLSYLCRPTKMQAITIYNDFIDKYVDRARHW